MNHHFSDESNRKLLCKEKKIEISKRKPIGGSDTNKLKGKAMATVEIKNYFNDKETNSNENDLDHLNNNHLARHHTMSSKNILANCKNQIKSTSFESNLTDEADEDDYNNNQSEPSVASGSMIIMTNGDSQSSTLDDEDDEEQNYKASEMDKLLNKKVYNDQIIVEVLRQLVRDCTNPDPAKRPSSFEVTDRLQPFFK